MDSKNKLLGKRKPKKQLNEGDIYADQITICTWNIGHISHKNNNLDNKKGGLVKLLERKRNRIDLLVLQEVNKFDVTFDENFLNKIKALGYDYDKGIKFKTGSNQYTVQKQGFQYEYYVLFYLKNKFDLEDIECSQRIYTTETDQTKIGLSKQVKKAKSAVIKNTEVDHEKKIWTLKGDYELVYYAQACEWTSYRPVLVRKLSLLGSNRSILLGTVHTSPSYDVVLTSKEYVKGMIQISQSLNNIPWILAGDWYVQDGEIIVQSGKVIKKANDWSNFLQEQSCLLLNPVYVENRSDVGPSQSGDIKVQTNFPSNGEGMIADYFISSKDFQEIQTYVLVGVEIFSSLNDSKEKSKQVFNQWYSDHAPVITKLSFYSVRSNASLSQAKSIFPQFSDDLTYAMSDEPVLLNGMKVLFDNPTPTTPVTLQPKQRGTNNGR